MKISELEWKRRQRLKREREERQRDNPRGPRCKATCASCGAQSLVWWPVERDQRWLCEPCFKAEL